MTIAEDIEKAIQQLAPGELRRLRAWFEAFDVEQFDAAIEQDASAGRLDAQGEEALAAHRWMVARFVKHFASSKSNRAALFPGYGCSPPSLRGA